MGWLNKHYKEIRNVEESVEDPGRRDFLRFMWNLGKMMIAYEVAEMLGKYGLAYARKDSGYVVVWDDPYYMKAIEESVRGELWEIILNSLRVRPPEDLCLVKDPQIFKEIVLNKKQPREPSEYWMSHEGSWYYVGKNKKIIEDMWYFIVERIFDTKNPEFDEDKSIILKARYSWVDQKTGKKFNWYYSSSYSKFKRFTKDLEFPFIKYVFDGYKGKRFPEIFNLPKEIFEIDELLYILYHGTNEYEPVKKLNKKRILNPIGIHSFYYKCKEHKCKEEYIEASLIYDFPSIYDEIEGKYMYFYPYITLEKSQKKNKEKIVINFKVDYEERKKEDKKIYKFAEGDKIASIMVTPKEKKFFLF